MTTIATWNLHHMGRQIAIPDDVAHVIKHVRPGVLVLTEYVDRGNRADFRAALRRLGYVEPAVTPQRKGQNQVLVASLEAQEDGRLEAPTVDEAAGTNFLHRWIPSLKLNIVGFRVPHYQSEDPTKLKRYWAELEAGALELADERTVYIGDFNVGTTRHDVAGRAALKKLKAAGYRMLCEEGGLDRALVSPSVTVRSFSVIEAVGDQWLIGKSGLSDHPMLVVEVK
jgi:exonuclease III